MIRSGSNVLIALAMPTPSASPRMRIASRAAGSPVRAAATTAWPSPMPRSRPRRSSARPAAWCSSEAGGGEPSAGGGPGPRAAAVVVWAGGGGEAAAGGGAGRGRRADVGGPVRGPRAGGAGDRAPADDDAAADAGADREHHDDVGERAHVVVVRLGKGGDGGVVVDE